MDNFLWTLISIADRDNFSTDILLNMSGGLVQGLIISQREYFDSLSTEFSKSFASSGKETQEGVRAAMMSHAWTKETEGDDVDDHYYIHLKNVVIHQGNTQFHTPLWRGRLSAVVGYTFGAPSRR